LCADALATKAAARQQLNACRSLFIVPGQCSSALAAHGGGGSAGDTYSIFSFSRLLCAQLSDILARSRPLCC